MVWFKYRYIHNNQSHTMQTIIIHCEIPFTTLMYIFTFMMQDRDRDNVLTCMTTELQLRIIIVLQLCNGKLIPEVLNVYYIHII